MVDWAYEQVAVRVADYRPRDQLRATQASAVLLGQLAAWLIVAYAGSPCCCGRSPPRRGVRLRRLRVLAVPGAVAQGRAGGPGPAVPARRVPVLQPGRPDDGLRHPQEPGPDAGISLTYAKFFGAVGPMRGSRLSDRARPGRGLAGLRRLAGQLRASGLRGGRRRLRRAAPVVRPAPAQGLADRIRKTRVADTARQNIRFGVAHLTGSATSIGVRDGGFVRILLEPADHSV
jgi:hypothetical protein